MLKTWLNKILLTSSPSIPPSPPMKGAEEGEEAAEAAAREEAVVEESLI